MWNECWSCEMSKKKSLPVFFFLSFLVFVSCRLPPFLLSHSLTRTNRNASSRRVWKSAGACAISQKKTKKKNCQSLLQCCRRHPPLSLCHTASHVRLHAPTANVIPTSPRLCFASSKAVVFPPGMSRRFLFHRHTVKFMTRYIPTI